MKTAVWSLIAIACAGLVLSSCTKPVENSAQPAAQSTNVRVFQVKGVVKAVRPERKEIEIKHEAIPDYMPAMTMPFDVRDTNLLTGLKPEQPVSFRLNVTDTDGWIDEIKDLGAPSLTKADAAAPPGTKVVRTLNVGEPLPEFHLTNELGQPITTSQYKGQALAITWLFTRCPFPTFCPRLANDFSETQEKLAGLAGGPTNWHLLTVSFDPEFDTPAALKTYALAHHYDPAHWTFATGNLDEITGMGDLFGLVFWHDSAGSITHNMRTVVIDADGRLQKVFEGKEWTSAELAAEVVKAAKR